jgi:hypothetical protein
MFLPYSSMFEGVDYQMLMFILSQNSGAITMAVQNPQPYLQTPAAGTGRIEVRLVRTAG